MMSHSSYPRLLGDIGGTNARFALQLRPGDAIGHARSLACAQFANVAQAVEHYLASQNEAPRPVVAAFGVATPVLGDRVGMTNHPWEFSISALQKSLRLQNLIVLNDFTALALALPALKPAELSKVCGADPVAGEPLAVLGAGTGLGVSGLIRGGEHWIPIAGEGGHVTLAAHTEREAALLQQLRKQWGHVSAERVLSGQGLVNLYGAVCALQQVAPAPLSAAEISRRALAGECSLCIETLAHFCAMLGTVASDLALTLGARGGVYLGGGIVPRLGQAFLASPFAQRFTDKGRYKGWLSAVPVYVITAAWPGLSGAARALEQR